MGTDTPDLQSSVTSGLWQDSLNGDFSLFDSQLISPPSDFLDLAADSSLSPHNQSLDFATSSSFSSPFELQHDHLLYGDFNGGFSFLESPSVSSPSDFLNLPPSPTVPPAVARNPTLNLASSSSLSTETDSPDDPDMFSGAVLTNIYNMLMEDEMDAKIAQFWEHPALPAAEQPFLEILGEDSSLYPHQPPPPSTHSSDSTENTISDTSNGNLNGLGVGGVAVENSWPYDPIEHYQLQINPPSADYASQSFFSPINSTGHLVQGFEESLLNPDAVSNLLTQSDLALQFRSGLEEAQKFLPSYDKLLINLEASGFSLPQDLKEESRSVKVTAEEEHAVHRGRKNLHSDDLDLEEGRSNKQSAMQYAVPMEEAIREMFDRVLLSNEGYANAIKELQKSLHDEAVKESQSNNSRGEGNGKGKGRKQSRGTVDLRTLLIHCAQAVATDDRRSANELLRQIRQHSSPTGDANQRLAHCFADGLEARLAGTGSQVYHSIVARPSYAVDMLNAYQLYMAACPFKKLFYMFSNQTILNAVERATKVHIIDYGIAYGFLWPCFLQSLAKRVGGPPKLRITGIDLPQPGFRPAERIEDTGRRLADYAQRFDVPFEFQPIAAKWETLQIEDLNIDPEEVLIVNSLFQFSTLLDETVVVDSPRDIVLNMIRKMSPHLFILGVGNGSYSGPFFVTRFREALFYYSAFFDMLEANVPRDNENRRRIEELLFGKGALNAIACEGSERVNRPETYKQWQARSLRAGLKQLPLSADFVKKARDKVRSWYHKDFMVDEDQQWLLQGWKGRILNAISTWTADNVS